MIPGPAQHAARPVGRDFAFRDDGPKRLVLVIVNNSADVQAVRLEAKGLGVSGKVTGEQSADKAFWQPLAPQDTTSASSFTVTLPPLSVTSLAAPLGP